MGEPITDRLFNDVVVRGFLPKHIQLIMYRDLTFDLAQIQKTMHHMYLDDLFRRNEAEVGSLDVVSTCHPDQSCVTTVAR